VATSAGAAWAAFGLEGRKAPLRRALEQLEEGVASGRGQGMLDELREHVAALLELPDPLQALEGAAAATKRAAGGWVCRRMV
jgi:hypothetical protein